MATMQAVINLISSDLTHAFSSPIELIPAPGPNKVIVVLSVALLYSFGGVAYNNSSSLTVKYGDGATNLAGYNNLLSAVVNRLQIDHTGGQINVMTVMNQNVILKNNIADPTQGNGTAKFVIEYIVVDFS